MIAKGSAASPGAACGKVCFTQNEALAAKANKEDAILVTVMTSQEDVKGMKASRGILTTTGTKVSHAAIMATAWGIPAVVGASEITIDKAAGTFSCNGYTVKRGDYITISGTTGEVYLGKVPMTVPSKLEESAQAILDWCRKSSPSMSAPMLKPPKYFRLTTRVHVALACSVQSTCSSATVCLTFRKFCLATTRPKPRKRSTPSISSRRMTSNTADIPLPCQNGEGGGTAATRLGGR